MVLAVEAGHRMDKPAVEKWMLWQLLAGITFLSCQAWGGRTLYTVPMQVVCYDGTKFFELTFPLPV